MTNIEQKALEMVNEVSLYKCENVDTASHKDLCIAFRRAIEQHEAFRQKVSDVVYRSLTSIAKGCAADAAGDLSRFIIPAPKPDPLVEALDKMLRRRFVDPLPDVLADEANWLRAALDALGFEIREKNDG